MYNLSLALLPDICQDWLPNLTLSPYVLTLASKYNTSNSNCKSHTSHPCISFFFNFRLNVHLNVSGFHHENFQGPQRKLTELSWVSVFPFMIQRSCTVVTRNIEQSNKKRAISARGFEDKQRCSQWRKCAYLESCQCSALIGFPAHPQQVYFSLCYPSPFLSSRMCLAGWHEYNLPEICTCMFWSLK